MDKINFELKLILPPAPWGQKQYEHHLVKTGSRR